MRKLKSLTNGFTYLEWDVDVSTLLSRQKQSSKENKRQNFDFKSAMKNVGNLQRNTYLVLPTLREKINQHFNAYQSKISLLSWVKIIFQISLLDREMSLIITFSFSKIKLQVGFQDSSGLLKSVLPQIFIIFRYRRFSVYILYLFP